VQTNSTSSPSTKEIDDDQTNQIDTMDLRDIVKDQNNENIFLTIDQSTTKEEDENNNDKNDHGLIQVSCSSSDEELDTKPNQSPQSPNKNIFNPNTKSTTEQQISSDHKHGEDDQHTTTTNLSNDNDNISKR
jgi:hypothetical protein